MLNQKKLDTKMLDTIKGLQIRVITVTYSISANGAFNTNIYTAINNDLPSGYKFLGIVGYATNNINAVINNLHYYDSNYSLQMWNRSNSALSNQGLRVYYLAIPI